MGASISSSLRNSSAAASLKRPADAGPSLGRAVTEVDGAAAELVLLGQGQGLARTDLPDLNRSLRRNINSARGYCPPIELAARRLAV